MAIAKSEYLEAGMRARWSGVETTWGTDPVGGIALPLVEDESLKIAPVKIRYEGEMAYGYPDENVSAVTPIGQTVMVSYRTPIFPEFAMRIASAITRSGDILRSYTFQKGHPTITSISDYTATGCKLGELTVTSNMSEPLVMADMSFTGYKAIESTSLTNTPAPTTPFRTRDTTITVGGTGLTNFESITLRATHDLSPGPPNASGYIGYLGEHFRHASLELIYPQTARAYVTEFINLTTTTQYNVVAVFGNGTNELTYTCTKSILEDDPIQEVTVKGVRKLRLVFKAKASGAGVGAWTLAYT